MQALLGFSRSGRLTIVRPFHEGDPYTTTFESQCTKPVMYHVNDPNPRASSPELDREDKTCYILRCPDEILLRCFEELADESFHARHRLIWPIWPLTLTCHRLHNLAQPLLYSHLELHPQKADDSRESIQTRRLEATIRRTTHAQMLCTSLGINFSPGSSYDHAFGYVVSMVDLLPSLRRLELSHLAASKNAKAEHGTCRIKEFEGDDEALPPPSKKGSSSLIELHLKDYSEGSPKALQNFLGWPAALERFSIDAICIDGYAWDSLIEMDYNRCAWSYGLIKELLSGHRSTLKSISLEQVGPQPEFEAFDLHDFTALEELQVCSLFRHSPSLACNLLLTASLRKLAFRFTCYDSQHGMLWQFSDGDADWLKEFIMLAGEKKRSSKLALAEIELIYGTSEYDREEDIRQVGEWIEEITHLGREVGIEITPLKSMSFRVL